jgi:hypothetical protein
VITSKVVALAALDRSKGGILPLAGREELIALTMAPDDPTERDAPLPSFEPLPSAQALPSSQPVLRTKESVSGPPSVQDGEKRPKDVKLAQTPLVKGRELTTSTGSKPIRGMANFLRFLTRQS